MHRTDFQQLTELRVREAEALRNAGYFEGAYYLLGYAMASIDPVVVDEFFAAVLDPNDGVLTWLKTQW